MLFVTTNSGSNCEVLHPDEVFLLQFWIPPDRCFPKLVHIGQCCLQNSSTKYDELTFPFHCLLKFTLTCCTPHGTDIALAAMLSQYCSFWGYPLCRLFYAFGLDVCLYSGLKWIKFPVTSLMQIEWEYYCYFNQLASWVLANIMRLPVGNVTETQDPDFCIVFCWNFWADAYRLIYTCCSELVTSVWIMAARH